MNTADKVGVLGTGSLAESLVSFCSSAGLLCHSAAIPPHIAEPQPAIKDIAAHNAQEPGEVPGLNSRQIADRDSIKAIKDCGFVFIVSVDGPQLLARTIAAVEATVKSDAVIGIAIDAEWVRQIVGDCLHPQRCITLNAISVLEASPLIEVVRSSNGPTPHHERLQRLLSRIGLKHIIVNDARDGFSNRVIDALGHEALALLGDGFDAASVEAAATGFGMVLGPLAVLDRISLERADVALHRELAALSGHEHHHAHDHHAHDHHDHHDHHTHDHHTHEHHTHEHHAHEHHTHEHHTHEHHAHEPPPSRVGGKTVPIPVVAAKPSRAVTKPQSRRMTESAIYVLEKMSHGFRRIGRAQGGGFYDYPQGDAPALWPGLRAFEKGRRKYPAEDIADRLVYAQLIESMRCLQEGVIASAQDADTASVHGWGFPAYRGGVAQYLNQVGVAGFVGRARELAQRYGERFEPPALLVRLASEGKSL